METAFHGIATLPAVMAARNVWTRIIELGKTNADHAMMVTISQVLQLELYGQMLELNAPHTLVKRVVARFAKHVEVKQVEPPTANVQCAMTATIWVALMGQPAWHILATRDMEQVVRYVEIRVKEPRMRNVQIVALDTGSLEHPVWHTPVLLVLDMGAKRAVTNMIELKIIPTLMMTLSH